MIEADLIKKHGKKALGMEEHGHQKLTWRQRLPEILLEIGIIVFAITLSIQLHGWHEHALNREAEHKFLVGLRGDLLSDLTELRDDSLAYAELVQGYRYFRGLTPATFHADTINKYRWTLYNSTNLLPNTSRFEGLRSSGKLGVIEDDVLLNAILDNYQELIPGLTRATQGFTSYKEQNIQKYLDDNLLASGANFLALMQSDRMRNYLGKDLLVQNILQRYHLVQQQNRLIIRRIDLTLAKD